MNTPISNTEISSVSNNSDTLPYIALSDNEVIINYHNNSSILQTMKDKDYLLYLLNNYDKDIITLIYSGHSISYCKYDIVKAIDRMKQRDKVTTILVNDIVESDTVNFTNQLYYQTHNILDIDIDNELISYVYSSTIPTVVVSNITDDVLFCNNEYATWCGEGMSMWDYIKEYQLIDNQLINMNVQRFPQEEFIKYKHIINNIYLNKLTRDVHWIANVQDTLHHLYADIVNICLGKDKPYQPKVLARVVQFTGKEIV